MSRCLALHNVQYLKDACPFSKSLGFSREREIIFLKSTKGFFNYIISRICQSPTSPLLPEKSAKSKQVICQQIKQIRRKQKNRIHRNQIAEGHKNTNVSLILTVCDVLFIVCWQNTFPASSQGFPRGPRHF
jgi:hypothetical protein